MTYRRTDRHHCHAFACEEPVEPRKFMCKRHWYTLPRELRDRIWATYRPGQEIDKKPSTEYLRAAEDAIRWLCNHEWKRPDASVMFDPEHVQPLGVPPFLANSGPDDGWTIPLGTGLSRVNDVVSYRAEGVVMSPADFHAAFPQYPQELLVPAPASPTSPDGARQYPSAVDASRHRALRIMRNANVPQFVNAPGRLVLSKVWKGPLKDVGRRVRFLCVCVQFPPVEEKHFDEWLPDLAPSESLHREAQRRRKHAGADPAAQETVWDWYMGQFMHEMHTRADSIEAWRELVPRILTVGLDVVLMCYCPDENRCHRSLVARLVRTVFPDA